MPPEPQPSVPLQPLPSTASGPSIEYALDTSTTPSGASLTVALITFNRPAAHNAFDVATIRALREALERAGADPAVRGVLLTGTGRAFCTGADVKELQAVAEGGSDGSAVAEEAGRTDEGATGSGSGGGSVGREGNGGSSNGSIGSGGGDEGAGPEAGAAAGAAEAEAATGAAARAGAGARLSRHIGLLTRYQHACIVQMRRMAKPVVVAVNGVVAGGGLPLALAGDYRLAADTARVKGAYFGVGVVPDGGITHFLPRLVGLAKAQELLLLDEPLDAAEAHRLGLFHRLCPPEELHGAGLTLTRKLASGPVWALGKLKLLLNQTYDTPLETQLEWERRYNMEAGASAALAEGVAAFVQKREPDFVRAEQAKG